MLNMNQQPIQGEVSSIGNGVRDERKMKSISSCKWLIQLKGPKIVKNLPGSKNPSGELTQAMSNFE